MPLEKGRRIGSYEILGPLGAGGMGEVYRARDASLDREVAIKALPHELSSEPQNVSRLEREAKLLAALRHPNIAVIHGVERSADELFLVLELIPGENLDERLSSGPLPLPDARNIFIQIARALEAAHDNGIVHRDLKPSNVKIDEEGAVKLLDFGLGKSLSVGGSTSKTATFGGLSTGTGLLLGTPAYMSPEQARGQTVSPQTDIWSFGVCLFEALTGRNPFAKQSLPDTLSAVLNEEPRWDLLEAPSGVAKLLRKCLRKTERERLQHIGDARIELEDLDEASTPRRRRGVLRILAIGAAALVIGVLVGLSLRPRPDTGTDTLRRFVIDLPTSAPISLGAGGALSVSADGSRLVYATRQGDRRELVLRRSDQLETVRIPGTEGAMAAFFSPSGDELAFFDSDGLRRIALPGGSPSFVVDVPDPRGATWLQDARVLYSPTNTDGLVSTNVQSTTGLAASTLASPSERSHRWPASLPRGEKALMTVWTSDGNFAVAVVQLGSGEHHILLENATYPRFLPPEHLLFLRDGDVFAVRLDDSFETLLSTPLRVASGIAHDALTGAAFYDVSTDGALFYVAAKEEEESLASVLFVSRNGDAQSVAEPRPGLSVPRLSPDGQKLLVTAQSVGGGRTDVFSLDLASGSFAPLTFAGSNGAAIWSHDGSRIFFSSDREDGTWSLYWKASDGSGEAHPLTEAEFLQYPTSLSPDGRLAYVDHHPSRNLDIWVLNPSTGKTTPIAQTDFEESGAVFATSANAIAYTSNESGEPRVYVRSLDDPERRRIEVSGGEGSEPVWHGNTLYFRRGPSMMKVDIRFEPRLEHGTAEKLFDAPYDEPGPLASYDYDADEDRFIVTRNESALGDQIQVLLGLRTLIARSGGDSR